MIRNAVRRRPLASAGVLTAAVGVSAAYVIEAQANRTEQQQQQEEEHNGGECDAV